MTAKLGSISNEQVAAQSSFEKKEQVRLLYMQALISNCTIIVISILYYFLLLPRLNTNLLLIWTLLLLAISSYRLYLWYSYKHGTKRRSAAAWLNLYLIGCGLLGISWSLIYPCLINSNDPIVLSSLLILAFGVMSSAVPILSACIPAFILYTYPQGIMLLTTLVCMGDVAYSWLAFAVAVYLLMLTLFTLNTNKSILQSITLQQQNSSLIEDLNTEINQRETLIAKRTLELKTKNEDLFFEVKVRKNAEEELRNSERKYRDIIDSSPDLHYRTDTEGRIIFISPSVQKISGYTVEELIGMKIEKFYVNRKERKRFLELLQENGFVTEYEAQLKRKNASTWWASTNAHFLKNNDGHILGVEGVTRDVTERKQMEDEKTKLETQLHQSQKIESIGTLAGGIAHEFNNMLAIIIGNNELIMEELPQSSLARESAEEIRVAGLRARDVVKQLLTFSKQDDAVKKVMDFTFVVQESMKLIRSSTPANIEIEQNLPADTYPIRGNETEINQLLINLCNNAVGALPEKGGRISIALSNETIDIKKTKHQIQLKPGQYAKLTVSDNGIGMDTEVLDRVFEPYFTTKAIGEGTGIGMAVVHGIVERHGGAIIIDSKPGRGTAITIFFPAHKGLLERETGERDSLPVGDEYILYVDDEPSIARLGQRLLESLGYTTESTTNPEKALDMVRKDPHKFDLLITDMAMPEMTGDQLIIEILKIRQDMPTIICTGYSAKISEKETADIGARSYIMKPINKPELATAVREVLDDAKKSNLAEP